MLVDALAIPGPYVRNRPQHARGFPATVGNHEDLGVLRLALAIAP
jgi:hypothetical protein